MMKNREFAAIEVGEFPDEIRPFILYVSHEYEIACHLCACGCLSKVYTPLSPAEWKFFLDGNGRPCLSPSIGNWALPCRSHYWIRNGKILWSTDWCDEKIKAGRQDEMLKRKIYYKSLPQVSTWVRVKIWIMALIRRQ